MRRLACAAALAVLAACSSKTDTPAPALSRVEVTPPAPRIPQGASAQLHATAVYSDGRTADVTEEASWSSSATGFVQVSDAAGTKGLAQGVAAGSATVTAIFQGVSGTASATVEVLAIASLEVAPPATSVPIGQDAQLTATATYVGGSAFDVTASAAWTSDTPAVATVSDVAGTKGLVHGVATGSAVVTAAFGGATATAGVTVTPATLVSVRVDAVHPDLPVGASTLLTATAVFSDGFELDVSGAAAWSGAPAGIVDVTQVAGVARATALAPGVATVTAHYQGISGTATVTVHAAALVSIEVTPASPSTVVGGTVQLAAIGTYSGGEVLDVSALATWNSLSPLVATVSNAPGTKGLVTGNANGGAEISASFGGATGSATVQVTTVVPAAIRIEPDAVTVAPARSVALRAFARDASGAEVEVTGAALWRSSATAIATVSPGGVLSGVALGTAVVTATFSGRTGSANALVETPYPISLAVVPDGRTSTSAGVGAIGNVRARALYSDLTIRDVTEASAWISDAPGVVRVWSAPGSKGVVEAVGPGTAHVGASFAGFSDDVTFTVAPKAVEWVVVSVPPSALPVGATQRLEATAVYGDWTVEDVTAVAAWTATGGAATVDAAGVVTTSAAGSAAVTATYGGVSGSTLILVTGASPSGLQFTLNRTSVKQGDWTWWSASLTYSNGDRYDVADGVQLVSRDPAIADVLEIWGLQHVPRGLTPGAATLEARYANLTATAVLTVTAPTNVSVILPSQIALGATVRAGFDEGTGYGDLADEATWTSSDASVLTVTTGGGWSQNGWVTAVGPGTATITATYGTITASRTVTVRPRAMTVAVSPAVAEIPQFDTFGMTATQQFTATATLADGTALDVTGSATWSTDPEVAGTYYGSGQISAGKPGWTLVTASYGDAAGNAILTVVESPPRTVTVSPSVSTYRLPKGVTVKLAVFAQYPSSAYETPTSGVTWTSSNPAVAAFSTDPAHEGELTTTSTAGTTTIRASYRGVSDPYPRTVVVDDPIAIAPPAPVTVAVGGSQPVQVQATYPNAVTPSSPYTFDLAPWTTWTSLDPAVAIASAVNGPWQSGASVAGVTQGSTTLTVAIGTWSAEVPVTVVVPTVTGLALALPNGDSLGVGTRAPITAGATLSNGDTVDVTGAVTGWTTTDAAVAEVTGAPPGVDAKANGAATIGASFGGRSGSVALSVTDWQAATLVFVPSVVSVPVGGAGMTCLQMPSTSSWCQNVGDDAVVTSSNPAVAQVTSANGAVDVVGLSPGSSVITATYRGQTYQALANVYAAAGPVEVNDTGMPWAGTRTVVHPRVRAALYPLASGPTMYLRVYDFPQSAPGATWATSDESIVRIVSPGLVEGVSPGVAEISATLDGSTSSMWVVVSGAAQTGVGRSDTALALPVGAEAVVHAYAIYTDGYALVDYAATWSSTNPAIAELVAGKVGTVHANAPGTAYVEMSFGGFTTRLPVTVFQP